MDECETFRAGCSSFRNMAWNRGFLTGLPELDALMLELTPNDWRVRFACVRLSRWHNDMCDPCHWLPCNLWLAIRRETGPWYARASAASFLDQLAALDCLRAGYRGWLSDATWTLQWGAYGVSAEAQTPLLFAALALQFIPRRLPVAIVKGCRHNLVIGSLSPPALVCCDVLDVMNWTERASGVLWSHVRDQLQRWLSAEADRVERAHRTVYSRDFV